ncbi:uncharacterized protein ACO6RY_17307 [Pungitius sinensis]
MFLHCSFPRLRSTGPSPGGVAPVTLRSARSTYGSGCSPLSGRVLSRSLRDWLHRPPHTSYTTSPTPPHHPAAECCVLTQKAARKLLQQ